MYTNYVYPKRLINKVCVYGRVTCMLGFVAMKISLSLSLSLSLTAYHAKYNPESRMMK